jgi:hypothetical protein
MIAIPLTSPKAILERAHRDKAILNHVAKDFSVAGRYP